MHLTNLLETITTESMLSKNETLGSKLVNLVTRNLVKDTLILTYELIDLLEDYKNNELSEEDSLDFNKSKSIVPVGLEFSDLLSLRTVLTKVNSEQTNCKIDYILSAMDKEAAENLLNVITRGRAEVKSPTNIENKEYYLEGSSLKLDDHASYYVFYESYFSKYHFIYVKTN